MTGEPEVVRDGETPAATLAVPEASASARLHVEFASPEAARAFSSALASLLFGSAESPSVVDDNGRSRDDLDPGEIAQRVSSGRATRLVFPLQCGGSTQRIVVLVGQSTVEIGFRSFSDGAATGLLWLQADVALPGPAPVLGLPVRGDALCVETLQATVALASRSGGFLEARLLFDGDTTPRRVWASEPNAAATVPVVGSLGDTVWTAGGECTAPSAPVAWCEPRALPRVEPVPPSWWSRFDDLARASAKSAEELEAHLHGVVPDGTRWRLDGTPAVRHADFATPPEDGLVLTLAPSGTEVVVAVDLALPAEALQPLLLHAVAHLALGHVRPDDSWGHWDTTQTATGERPRRYWDREAKEYLGRYLRRPTARRVESLEDCTATEKALLGLWRTTGELLGESRRLHPAAVRYQKAAYQRQAAQRMVAMLEEYGGAMLCDGVGLGKTYVATTLMVHYANCWRDQWASSPDRLLEDPFRVTVLAPNSVVSTWRREALPALAAFGVPLATVRVVSHTKLSRITRTSDLLDRVSGGVSDLEHLLLSDLVVVDEAHNFRTLAARRTKVLRDLLRLQPRRETRRRVAVLTATPVNNSLDDLRQETSLLFSRPLFLSDARTDEGYRRQAVKEVQDRCARARSIRSQGDLAPLLVHGQADARFSDTIEFRDDLDFGPNVQRIGDYLKEQDKRLRELQARVRQAAQNGSRHEDGLGPVRIAEDLLDRVVVQRSRDLCKEIERQQATNVQLLFRPDAGVPERLYYSDEYDGIEDVLAGFLPLFDTHGDRRDRGRPPLGLKVYMWYDVREGLKSAQEVSSVVGLQRVLALKRLESSPVSFLGTLLRLTVLHAHRLHQLSSLCRDAGDGDRHKRLQAELSRVLGGQSKSALEKVRTLATGETRDDPRADFVRSLGKAYTTDRPVADDDDVPAQLSLFAEEEVDEVRREQLDRLWELCETLVADFETLLKVTPELADVVFGKFARDEWPRRFVAGGESVDWPRSPDWGLRIVTDPKIRQLVGRLVLARRAKQKAIVFSQFADTVAYLRSVLAATEAFERQHWQVAVRGLGVPGLTKKEVVELREATAAITGDTEDREDVVNAFAPFYRIGPWRPAAEEATESERRLLFDGWETAWTGAVTSGVDVLLSTDVLAEGVNLQDAALLVNFDVHWNPVRMIQRSGRIDRRLNPRIEQPREFPDLAALAARLGKESPRYYWHDHPEEAPVTVNMILPDQLEAELRLRERIATKTLAIDFTLGLEQGTGVEADWMENYQYHGIKSLNSFQRDRAIEQVASHHERLSRRFAEAGIRTDWVENLNGWFRGGDADQGSPLVARAVMGRLGGELERFLRYLEPIVVDGVPYWFWAEKKPGESMFDGWLTLDGKTWPPPAPRRDIPWHDSVASPLKASHLLAALERIDQDPALEEWSKSNKGVGRLLQQGGSAIAAPKLGEDRHLLRIASVFVLQLQSFEPLWRGTKDDGATDAK